MKLSCIVIDDAELDHFIAGKLIGHTDKETRVKNFLDANLAFEYIKTRPVKENEITLVILDIYMPLMNGFQFVEAFETLDPNIQERYYLVALTSGRRKADLNRISSYPSVKVVLNKPITIEALSDLLTGVSIKYGIQL